MIATRFDGMGLSAAQALYRELILKFHPDNAETGDAVEACNVNAEWQAFTAHVVNDAFSRAEDERAGKTGDNSADAFAEILRAVAGMDCRAEIIGFWIYAFESFNVKEELKAMGFWFSAKHRAWIFSGTGKKHIRGYKTTEQNRAKWGSSPILHTERKAEQREEIA